MPLEIVLLQNVDKLGKAGDVVSVKEGYARNFLLRFDLAMLATPAAKDKAKELRKQKKTAGKLEEKELKKMAKKISEMEFVLKRKAENGKLFGSVTDSEIIKLLEEQGVELKKNQLKMKEAVKKIGNYEIEISLSKGVSGKIRLKVVDEKK